MYAQAKVKGFEGRLPENQSIIMLLVLLHKIRVM